MNIHVLDGCAPRPLANYLKALGVLRLLAEQVDPEVRGFWQDDRFVLVSCLDRPALLRFFMEDYRPTPLLSPWNGGSGFYPKDNMAGLEAIATTTSTRFAPYRMALATVHAMTDGMEQRPGKKEKAEFIRRCRNSWSDQQLPWMNATLAVLGEDLAFPSLLGSGGNDGRLDFTNNFMQRLTDLLIDDRPVTSVRRLLEASLFDEVTPGLEANAVGQFQPGNAGGMNAGPGFDGDKIVNGWDFVLMLEGALAFQVAVKRQLDTARLPVAAAPFAFRSRAAGYGSATRSEESARGEQWFPLWTRPMSNDDLQAVFREGRMQTGAARATGAIDAALAIGSHGTARGIVAFERYAYIERNGLSNLAVPLGRWDVEDAPAVRLVGEIDSWVGQLRRASRDPQRDPASLRRQVRRLEGCILALLQHGRGSQRARLTQDLVIALGMAEQGLLARPKHTAAQNLRPLPRLSTGWLDAVDDGTPEARLAIAFATQRAQGRSLHAHMVPLDEKSYKLSRFASGPSGLILGPDLSWTGRDLIDDLVGIVMRRLVTNPPGTGLDLRPMASCSLADVLAFVMEQTDNTRVAGLARGLMTVQLQKMRKAPWTSSPTILPAYALLRCAHPGRLIPDSVLRPSNDARAATLLTTGRVADAGRLLARRLAARGLRPRLDHLLGDRAHGRRLLASLAFPISNRSAQATLRSIIHVASDVQGVPS